MCPPATTPDAIGLYWTDEQIISLLEKVKNGSLLPNNVSEDINPYRCLPSNLQPEIWYLVLPTESKKMEHGFWKAKGEGCEISQNRSSCVLRTTLEFYEGPNERKTNWVMQEYKITQKGGYNEKSQHSRALCRVFQCCGGSPNNMQLEKKPAVADRGNVANSMLVSARNANRSSGVGSTSESQAKSKGTGSTQSPLLKTSKDPPVYLHCFSLSDEEDYIELDDLAADEALINKLLNEDGLGLDDLTEIIRQSPSVNKPKDPDNEALIDQILKEDFMELDDLEDPKNITDDFLELNDLDGIVSHSSSSGNSSHQSLVSEDDFFAVVRNMDNDNNGDPKGKDSSYKCRNMGPVKPDEVIIQLAPSGSLVKGAGSKAAVKTPPTSSIQIKPSQTQLLAGQHQITEKKVQQTLRPAATKNKFKKVHDGVAQKLYCDRKKTKET